jgi:hypothetical protein
MVYNLILIAHLSGAAITALFAAVAVATIWFKKDRLYRPFAMVLGIVASFEIVTGTILSVLSYQISALSLCGNIALYLTTVGLIEVLLFLQMRQKTVVFPARFVFSSIGSSLVLFAAALASGF